MKLVLLGAPGAGKGTQAAIISKKQNIPHISTGDIIRKALKDGTDLGKEAKEYINKGLLVPDDIVINIIKERLNEKDCLNGFILDGFPRTVPQGEALDKMGVVVDKVLSIETDDEVITERLTGRRQCSNCNTTYHIKYNAPKLEGICDVCGKELIIREDDAKETVINRLKVYHESTEQLKDFYKNKGLLVTVMSENNIEETTVRIFKALGDE